MILPGPSTPHFISCVTKIAAYFLILHPIQNTHFFIYQSKAWSLLWKLVKRAKSISFYLLNIWSFPSWSRHKYCDYSRRLSSDDCTLLPTDYYRHSSLTFELIWQRKSTCFGSPAMTKPHFASFLVNGAHCRTQVEAGALGVNTWSSERGSVANNQIGFGWLYQQ